MNDVYNKSSELENISLGVKRLGKVLWERGKTR